MIGKIYILKCNISGLQYIGSTIQKLNQRLSQHKNQYKRYVKGLRHYMTSYEIIKNNDYSIELIEEVEYDNIIELHKIELKYINSIDCVNKCIPPSENKDYRKEKITCCCGSIYSKSNKSHHEKTKKHKNFFKQT